MIVPFLKDSIRFRSFNERSVSKCHPRGEISPRAHYITCRRGPGEVKRPYHSAVYKFYYPYRPLFCSAGFTDFVGILSRRTRRGLCNVWRNRDHSPAVISAICVRVFSGYFFTNIYMIKMSCITTRGVKIK